MPGEGIRKEMPRGSLHCFPCVWAHHDDAQEYKWLSLRAGTATAEQPEYFRLAQRPRLRLGHRLGTQLRVRVRPDLRRPHAVFWLAPVQGRVEEAVVHTVLPSVMWHCGNSR